MASLGQVSGTLGLLGKMQILGFHRKPLLRSLGTGSRERALKLILQETLKYQNGEVFLAYDERPTLHCHCHVQGSRSPVLRSRRELVRGLGAPSQEKERTPFRQALTYGSSNVSRRPGRSWGSMESLQSGHRRFGNGQKMQGWGQHSVTTRHGEEVVCVSPATCCHAARTGLTKGPTPSASPVFRACAITCLVEPRFTPDLLNFKEELAAC